MKMDEPKETTTDQEKYDAAYKESATSSSVKAVNIEQWNFPLVNTLTDMFNEAERDRRPLEQRWIRDLRQTKNEYDPEIMSRIHPKRSKSFLGITRTKVKTICARMTDLLFPPGGDKNWGVQPTPVPELSQELQASIVQQIQQITGSPPSSDELKLILFEEAKKRSEAMEKEIEDQLAELKYRDIIRSVIRSGNIYGTGILKGPLVREQTVKRWAKGATGWQTIEFKYLMPYCENVDLWDVYPDMTARNPEDVRYVFQRHVMSKHKLQQLSARTDFNGQAIREYIKQFPGGDATSKTHEEDLRNLASKKDEETVNVVMTTGKYEMFEFWGFINTSELEGIPGVTVPADLEGLEVAANCWMIGNIIVKAVISKVDGALIPYHWYFFEKDETCLFGEGIPCLMRDVQKLLNATTRAMVDNAAISAGPLIEANKDLLAMGEDPTDIYPFRVFQRTGMGMEASTPAIRVTSLPSYTGEFMNMLNLWMTMADETTSVPRYMAGDNASVQGAGRTATGLSMLMGAANIVLKDQVRNFDDGITKPFIKAMYFWNMKLNAKPEIKGDFNVIPKGSTSLIAKEVRSEQLNTFLNITNNPVDLAITNRDVILRELAKALDLSDLNLIKAPPQVKVESEQAGLAANADKQFAKDLAMIKAQSGGHMAGGGGGQQTAASSGNGPDMTSGGAPGGLPPVERLPQAALEAGKIPEVGVGQ